MGSSPKGKKSYANTSFALGSISVGSLFGLAGAFCMFYFYPMDCPDGRESVICTPRQTLLLFGIIVFVTSGVLMMLCGLVMLCCCDSGGKSSKKANDKKAKEQKAKEKKAKDAKAVLAKTPSPAAKPNKTNRMSTTFVLPEEDVIVVKETETPRTIIYNFPPEYFDRNLVLGSQHFPVVHDDVPTERNYSSIC